MGQSERSNTYVTYIHLTHANFLTWAFRGITFPSENYSTLLPNRDAESEIEKSMPWWSESSGIESLPESESENRNFPVCSAFSPTRVKRDKSSCQKVIRDVSEIKKSDKSTSTTDKSDGETTFFQTPFFLLKCWRILFPREDLKDYSDCLVNGVTRLGDFWKTWAINFI